MERTSRDGLRDRWRTEVIKSSRISDSVRIVLIVMADSMTDAGYISMSRRSIADTINRTPRRVAERIDQARKAGLLAAVRPGRPGQTAEYVATFPESAATTRIRPRLGRTSAPWEGRTSAPSKSGMSDVLGADYSTHSMRTSAPSQNGHNTETAQLFETHTNTPRARNSRNENSTNGEPAGFADWYEVYPRKAARIKAAAAYAKAIKNGVAPDTLLAGAQRYRDERQGQDPKFTRLATTWLNAGCWSDDPMPARTDAPRTSGPAAVGLTAEHYSADPNDPSNQI